MGDAKLVLAGACVIGAVVARAGMSSTDPVWPVGGDVTIAAGDTVVLTASTPQLNSLTVAGTLSCSNWMTCVKAMSVTVAGTGRITVPCAFTQSQMSNRVWVVCTDFDLRSGGAINVDAKGWGPCSGVGSGLASSGLGGGYGGRGGNAGSVLGGAAHYYFSLAHLYGDFSGPRGGTYGSISEPTDPGSSGGGRGSATAYPGRPGGGAVRIEASGHVRIDGTISAVGGAYQAGAQSAGSGGSIWISCATVDGAGLIDAGGGSVRGVSPGNGSVGGGGGGRVALTWSDAAAQKSYSPALRFGLGGAAGAMPCSVCRVGEPGTLYLTDASFFPSANTFGGGRVTYADPPESLAFADFTLTGAALEFVQDIPFSVSGDLVVADGAELVVRGRGISVGGNVLIDGRRTEGSFGSAALELFDGAALRVGGGLTVRNSSCLWMQAGVTAGEWGTDVRVAGDVVIGDGCSLFPCSHPTDSGCGANRLVARNVTVEQNGAIDGYARGFQPVVRDGSRGSGPGGSRNFAGASHVNPGGRAARDASDAGAVYDAWKKPRVAGSSSGYRNSTYIGLPGGGQLWLEASGTVRIDGRFDVSARNPVSGDRLGGGRFTCYNGSGSGGSIYISAAEVVGDGSILADGGPASLCSGSAYQYAAHPQGGGGAGGAIAIYTDEPFGETFSGTCSCRGGDAYCDEANGRDSRGADGTLFTQLRGGVCILFQ